MGRYDNALTDWNALHEAAGRLGYRESEFWNTTPRYFYAALRGQEQAEQAQWERMRWLAYFSFVPHAKKNALKGPKDLMQFPWETERVKRTITAAMVSEADAEWEKMKAEAANKK